MPSPFPGMDPYLEGWLWPDVHHALAVRVRAQLAARVSTRYVVRLEISMDGDDVELGFIRPDVYLAEPDPTVRGAPLAAAGASVIVAPVRIPRPRQDPVHQATVEIRDIHQDIVVTAIEILSHANKREPGLARYREKRDRYYDAGVSLVEIDLLRRGTRPMYPNHRIDGATYLIAVTRAGADVTEAWPFGIRDQIPVVPVPLADGDADLSVDTGIALSETYNEARYGNSIDYAEDPPPPAFSPEDGVWMRGLLRNPLEPGSNR